MDTESLDKIRRFYAANRSELYVYALSLTANAENAEDAVHAAFEGLLKRRRLPRALRPFAFRCVRNAVLDQYRKAQTAAAQRDRLFRANGHPDPGLPLLVEDALGKLSADEREAIVLKVYSGLTLREIAQMRAVSINTAASWHRRGLEKLRAILEEPSHGH